MDLPDKNEFITYINRTDLNQVPHPVRLGGILEDESSEATGVGDRNLRGYLEGAEKHQEIPREAVYIQYWDLDDELEQRLLEGLSNSENTRSDGSDLAYSAIKALEEIPVIGFSTVIGFELEDFDERDNLNQFGGPQGSSYPVELPDWYSADDQVSDLPEDDFIGFFYDSHTVYPLHIRDNLMRDERVDIGEEFWEGFNERLENYVGI